MIKEFNLTLNVDFMGRIPYAAVLEILSNSDIFVFPTFSEMMPRAVIEAMWLGKPVIASKVDGIIDLIIDGQTGFLVEPGNEIALKDAILKLMIDPILATEVAKRGQDFIRNYCSIENVGRAFNYFYDQLLEKQDCK
jgi:glycosyltransferase involved in cell wall biosynthesis